MKTAGRGLLILILSVILSAGAAAEPQSPPGQNEVSRTQLEAQIAFFRSALDEFAATSPEQAVTLWIKGFETRNGVYQYAVACELLKQELIRRWGKPEQNYWNIGVSSPWFTGVTILDKKTLSQTEMKYRIQYFWATSAGPEKPTVQDLTLSKNGDTWCVNGVTQIEEVQTP